MGPVKVVFVNIAFYSGRHQARNGLIRGQQLANACRAVRHQGHVQRLKARLQGVGKGKIGWQSVVFFTPRTHAFISPRGADYSDAPDLLDLVPMGQRTALVITQQQKKLRLRKLVLQLIQRIHRVAGACALGFSGIQHHLGQVLKSQLTHRQAVCRAAQRALLVPSLTGGQHPDLGQLKLTDSGLDQGHVRQMRRIKCTAENP